ncbi:MAG: peptidoglycan bridge formation glycyltransferase FemA/FemB family protein [Candidatus Gracilibacteria bacterium]|jgi:lipid II:glycine glycyltransferase (peptidoglycan interpeptide bridge formation enzyme)
MEAKILTKSEEKKWDDFVYTHPLATIHQTSAWGHFQEKIAARGKYWIVVLENNGKIIGGSMVIRHVMAKGYSWLYCARGPLLDYHSKNLQEQIDEIIKILSPIAKSEKAIFIRIDPPLEKSNTKNKGYLNLKSFKISNHGFQPEHTLILDITKSEDEILAQMKPKGRYNIGLAKKKGVTIHKSKDTDAFHKILNETTTRDNFHGHNKDFYENMINTLNGDGRSTPLAELYLAKFEGKSIAGIITTFYKNTAVYYYGASSNEHRETMAPYLLQWIAIKDAKEKGLKSYDFLGIAPEGAANHPWAGVTEFKLKFGGARIDYQPAQEYSFKKLHHLAYRALKKLR